MNDPTDFEDARWRNLVEADATGEDLSASEREFLRRHKSRSREVQAEQALLEALGHIGDDDTDGEDGDIDDPVVGQIVRRYLDEKPVTAVNVPTAETPSRAWWPWAAVTIAAASLATVWLWPDSTPLQETITRATAEGRGSDDAPSPAPPPGSEHVPEVFAPRMMLASGRLEDAQAQEIELEPVTATGVVRAAGSDTCVQFGSDTACFDDGTQLQLHQRGDAAWIEIVEGTARVRSEVDDPPASDDGPAPTATTFAIRVAGTSYTSIEPAVWSVEVHNAAATVDVARGKVRAAPQDGSPTTLEPGLEPGDTTVSVRVPDADTLLQRAREHRAEGARAAAIRDYEALVRHHPRAPAVGPSLVTLGELHLEAGHAKTALRWFDRYLAQGGALEEEAMYGRIRALRALGRDQDESEAVDRFLQRFPSSSYASKLRRSP